MTPKRILLVEDQPDHAELMMDLVQAAGYEVVHCSTGEDALGTAKRFAPHLVLMDINLSGMDGLAATRLLKRHDETAHIPVLALTAYAMPAEQEKILAAGCVGVVTKPIDARAFLARVADIMGGPSSERAAPPAALRSGIA